MLIVQCDAAQLPGLYSEVVDRKMMPVGRIVDLFGNVQTPYAAVLCKKQCTIAPQEKLFAKGTAQTGRDRTAFRKKA
jgi:RNA-binding protein